MTPQLLVTSILTGHCPDVPVWDLSKAVRTIADGIATKPGRYDATGAWKACNALNRERHFALTLHIGQAWFACRDFSALLAKHYAQALIELSHLQQADALLDQAIEAVQRTAGARTVHVELAEYRGQKARICKQAYVDDGDPARLVQAFDAYHHAYLDNRLTNYWHGVNALALLARAERIGMTGLAPVSSRELARQLLSDMQQRAVDSPWKMASMAEVCLALDEPDHAELWLYRLLHAPQCTPFMLESLGRQLREIWDARALDGGVQAQDRLASIIARHQMARLSLLSLTPPASRAEQNELERNFQGTGAFSIDTIKQILSACASIGCVCNSHGVRLGTGFLLDGAALGLGGAGPVFVTNAHVLSDTVPGAIRPSDALVTFELDYPADGKPVFHKIAEILLTSPPGPLGQPSQAEGLLDVSVARLEQATGYGVLQVSALLPIVDGQAKAYVIGHPRGSGLQIAVHDSELLAVDDANRLVHYRTPTDPGSSGSPVFNEDWRLIALHHGGSSTMPRFRPAGTVYQANEGVTIQAIRAGIRLASLGAAMAGPDAA